jgi:MYXO-CTERM domain-containing protein
MPRHLMEPDPDAAQPPFVLFLWLLVLVLAFVLVLALGAPTS